MSWSAASAPSGITGYQVQLNGGAIQSTTSLSYNFSGLASGAGYYAQVRAQNGLGVWSSWTTTGVTTSPGSGGGGAGTPGSIWHDLDGDGIKDEIVKAVTYPDSGEFSYAVESWYTYNYSYASFAINDYWEYLDVDYLNQIRPSFSVTWWYTPFFWQGYDSGFQLLFALYAPANQAYKIYEDKSGSLTMDPNNWEEIFSVASSSGWTTYFTYPLDSPDDLPGTQYFMVREGKPVGSAEVALPGGAKVRVNTQGKIDRIGFPGAVSVTGSGSTLTVTTNGSAAAVGANATVNLPNGAVLTTDGSGNATITLSSGHLIKISTTGTIDLELPVEDPWITVNGVSTVGGIVNNASNGAVYSVKRPGNQSVPLLNNGVLDRLDIGISESGEWQIGVRIGSQTEGQTVWIPISVVRTLPTMESAPNVLRVNANFDEQKFYALSLIAQPDHFDESLVASAGPNAGKIIVQDLHEGLFGMNPTSLPAEFFIGATVTIEKVLELDSETGAPKLGKVRFYATRNLGQPDEQFWTIPFNENLVPILYAETPVVPKGQGVKYWIEGVKPGPITLEFKYEKGSLTFNHKQTFLVATHQTKAQWQEEIRQQILLQSSGSVDLSAYSPPWSSAPFLTNKAYIQNVYAYYEYLHLERPHLFLWAGLAKMAGGPVYGGMVDAEYARSFAPSWIPGATTLLSNRADFFQETLMKGNYDILDDLAWQFRAYEASGIWALRYVDETSGADEPAIRSLEMQPWESLWLGEYTAFAQHATNANYLLTRREQQFIVQEAWNDFKANGFAGIEYLLNILARSPLDGVVYDAKSFWDVVGATKDITEFSDRWDWVDHPSDGIWQDWVWNTPANRATMVSIPLQFRAETFSLFYTILGGSNYPLIW